MQIVFFFLLYCEKILYYCLLSEEICNFALLIIDSIYGTQYYSN